MIIKGQEFHVNGLTYTIRSAAETDANSCRKLEFRSMEKLKIWIEKLERDLQIRQGFKNNKTDSDETKNLFQLQKCTIESLDFQDAKVQI